MTNAHAHRHIQTHTLLALDAASDVDGSAAWQACAWLGASPDGLVLTRAGAVAASAAAAAGDVLDSEATDALMASMLDGAGIVEIKWVESACCSWHLYLARSYYLQLIPRQSLLCPAAVSP